METYISSFFDEIIYDWFKTKEEKTYILQKDLPDGSKAGDEYIYLFEDRNKKDFLGREVYANKEKGTKSVKWSSCFVENNPDWFKIKEELKNFKFKDYDKEDMRKCFDESRVKNLSEGGEFFYKDFD